MNNRYQLETCVLFATIVSPSVSTTQDHGLKNGDCATHSKPRVPPSAEKSG
jgi:hypothetical protein